MRIDKDTQLCLSLSGRPGNFGTRFHNFLFERLNLNFLYKGSFTNDIGGAVSGIRALGIRGSAVSMPFKESCMEFLDELDDSAAGIGAVNTIVNTDGVLRGHNTDYVAVRQLLSGLPPGLRFHLLGSGGMAKALAAALQELGFAGTITSRNEKTGSALAARYGFSYLSSPAKEADLLINASPIGMLGSAAEGEMPFSSTQIQAAQVVFEVVIAPTPFVRSARASHKQVITGFEVIVLQAVEQFALYTGVRPSPELVAEAADFARK